MENIARKTRQETFDTVVKHFAFMEGPAVSRNEQGEVLHCLYRGPNGSKCFAGALIPDELYTPDMEGAPANRWPVAPVIEGLGYDPEFVRSLQGAHDDHAWNSGTWRGAVQLRLKDLAETNNLK